MSLWLEHKGLHVLSTTMEVQKVFKGKPSVGDKMIVVNQAGKKTINQPFGTFYHPDVTEAAKARVFAIRPGDKIRRLRIVAPGN